MNNVFRLVISYCLEVLGKEILCPSALETLFIQIRSDNGMRGFRIRNAEIRLTSYMQMS